MHNRNRLSSLKVVAACLMLILNVGYVTYSYHQVSKMIQEKREDLFLQTKKEINQALQNFSKYLNLTEARLLHSLDEPETISRILSEKIEESLHKDFPEFKGVSFFANAYPDLRYTRFGKAFHQSVKQEEGVTYLGRGTFEWIKHLYNESKQPFGTLDSIFSLNKILHKHFLENEISVLLMEEAEVKKYPLFFKIDHLPYAVVASSASFTFWQFLREFTVHLFSILFLSLLVFFVGITTGISTMRRTFVKQRAFIHRLQDKLKNSDKKHSDVGLQLTASQNLSKRREHSLKARDLLRNSLTQRYRQMAGQAQAINMWTSQLILEEAQNDHLLKKIHHVSQEGTTVLRQLVNGFPMKFIEEEIDVLECIHSVKEIFLPQMIEKNVDFKIKGKVEKPPQVDKVIFEIILHNIFHIVMDRLSKEGVFIIDLKKGPPLQIRFHDSGYDIGPKIQLVEGLHPPEDILCLDQARLEEFTTYLDYKLSFESTSILTNTIKLTFPLVLEESERPSNVINLFGEPHEQ